MKRILIANGGRFDLADNRGRTTLMIAAQRGHTQIVSRLLELGADRACKDRDGKTAKLLATNNDVRKLLSTD